MFVCLFVALVWFLHNSGVANSVSRHVVKIVKLPTLICKSLLANNTRLARMANTLMDDINYELG